MVHQLATLISVGLSVFVCSLFLEASAAGQETGPPSVAGQSNLAKSQHQLTIVTLGDSITKGVRTGVTSQQTFAALLEKELKTKDISVRVINIGIGGERTDQALKRLEGVISLKPDIVTIMYGTNDSYVDQGKTASRITVDEYRKNLNAIVIELLRRESSRC